MRRALASGLRSLAGSKDNAAPNATNDFSSDTIAAQATEDAEEQEQGAVGEAAACPPLDVSNMEEDAIVVGDDEGLDYPSPPTNEAPPKEEAKEETKRGKATECCALCTEPFTPWGSSLKLSTFLQKAPIRRTKHNCRVCARPVCAVDGQSGDGCCHKARVPKRLWHRTLAGLRKEDTKVRRLDCEWCSQSKDTVPSAGPVGKDVPASADGEATEQSDKTASPSPGAECTCAEGWLCFDCEKHVGEAARTTIFDDLEKAVGEDNLAALHCIAQRPLILWLHTLDCDEALDAQHFARLSQRLLRVLAYVNDNVAPSWPRPAPKPRSYSSQVGYSALEAFNFVAGGKLRLAVRTAQLAAQGYAFSEYILSEEFVLAWRLLLDQLGEFVDDDTGDDAGASALPAREASGGLPDQKQQVASVSYRTQATQAATAAKQRAVVAFDICKRFYYYSLHLALEQLKQDGRRGAAGARVGEGPAGEGPADKNVSAARIPETEDDDAAQAAEQYARAEEAEQACTCNTCNSASPGASGGGCPASVAGKHATISEEAASEEQRVAAVLDAACEYLHVAALLYDSSDAAERRPSQDADAEATWFLSKSIWADGFVLLEYVAEAGRDLRPRSKTYGAAHPAFAVLINRALKVVVVAVRGSKGKKDHLIDIDFQYDLLLSEAEAKVAGGWQGQVHRGMLKCARFILQTWGLRSLLTLLPADLKIRFVGHSLGAGTAALMLAILKADPLLSSRDLRVHAFGSPACVCPELSRKLQPFVTSVIHREDMVPRLSFSNLVRLRTHFNRPEEKEWCTKQIDTDYDNFWSYIWATEGKKHDEMRERDDPPLSPEPHAATAAAPPPPPATAPPHTAAEAAAERGQAGGALRGHSVLGDLVVPGRVIHLREDASTGCYKAVVTDHTDPELQWIKVQLRAIDDHYIKSYLHVIRGLKLRGRIPKAKCQVTRRLESAVADDGSWRVCAVCERDVCEMLIFKSDAHRAKALKHCMQCGKICCMDCAPAADKLPDLSRELWATRRTSDKRIVLPELGTLEPQRLCLICHAHRDNRLT